MVLTSLMANLTVSDLDRSRAWYAALVGREPERAGAGGVVLGVDDLAAAVTRLDDARIAHDEPFDATYSQVLVLADPDGNRVVLTAPFGDRGPNA